MVADYVIVHGHVGVCSCNSMCKGSSVTALGHVLDDDYVVVCGHVIVVFVRAQVLGLTPTSQLTA